MTDKYSHADGSRECRPVVGHGSTLRPTPEFGRRSHQLYDEKCGYDPVREAATALYFAGRWEIPVADPTRPHPCPAESQAALWERLRDALGIEPGSATALGMGQPKEIQVLEIKVDATAFLATINQLEQMRDRVQGLFTANNREVFRRREGEALLRECAELLRTYEKSHRAKANNKTLSNREAIDRLRKAERNAQQAGRIEAFLDGASA